MVLVGVGRVRVCAAVVWVTEKEVEMSTVAGAVPMGPDAVSPMAMVLAKTVEVVKKVGSTVQKGLPGAQVGFNSSPG